MPLNGELAFRVSLIQSGALAQGGPYAANDISWVQSILSGVGLGQADQAYISERTLTSGSTDSLDVAAGGLLDMLGNVITMVKIKGIILFNQPKSLVTDIANTTDLTLMGGSNPFTGILAGTTPTIGPIKPGGIAMLFAPHLSGIGAVVAATGDIVRIVNSAGATAKYQIALIGTSA